MLGRKKFLNSFWWGWWGTGKGGPEKMCMVQETLRNLVEWKVATPWHGSWNEVVFKAPSKPSHSMFPFLSLLPSTKNLCGLNHNHFALVHRNPLQLQVSFWEKQLSVQANSSYFSKFSHGHFTLQAHQLQKMKDFCRPAFIQKLLFPTDLESCISVGDVWYIITAVLGEVQSVTAYTQVNAFY